jgi:hypothetical protein
MLHAGGIEEVADDRALGVDAVTVGGNGAAEVQLHERAALVQEAVTASRAVGKAANDLAADIEAESEGGGGTRWIDRRNRPSCLMNARSEPAVSVNAPTISPRSLMPKTTVLLPPGKSIWLNLPADLTKPWVPPAESVKLPAISRESLMDNAWVLVAPGKSICVKAPS